MKILAIDSSSVVATVGIIENDTIVGEYTINTKMTHSQTLLPMIEALMTITKTEKESLDGIAVSGGPGSFTGLRIGSATAKGLGLALDIPIIHVPTLEALAYNMCGIKEYVCPIMDARRNSVYTAMYHFEGEEIITDINQCQMEIPELIKELSDRGIKVVFLGDGVKVYKDALREGLGDNCVFAPVHKNMQSAASLAVLSKKYYENDNVVSADNHEPDYLRKSQAERELQEKHNA